MAFREILPEAAVQQAALTATTSEALGLWHNAATADLLRAAEAAADANTNLAAVAKWRGDQEARRIRWVKLALLLITSGDNPDAVCAGLGLGRTALQQAVRNEKLGLSAYTNLVYKARPKRKKAVA